MFKKILVAIGLGILSPGVVFAQADPSGSLTSLGQWLAVQQAQVGTAIGFQRTPSNKPVEYATTYWDAVSIGQSGINVGLASALDFVDLSLGLSAANQETTRYGVFIPIHVGNIWNSAAAHFPAAIADHVYLTSLPNVTAALALYEPTNGALNTWTIKKDGQISIAYRFGGAPTTAAGKLALHR